MSFGFSSDQEVLDNLELAYAISVHKAQGSEFEHVYFIIPKSKRSLLSRELFYTGITRARTKCTLFVEGDMMTLFGLQRPESSHLSYINSSLFAFTPVPDAYLNLQRQRQQQDYVDGPVADGSLVDAICRYQSDSQIARLLIDGEIPFMYQIPIMDDATGIFLLPTFTIMLRGETFYWEHIGLEDETSMAFWEEKLSNYAKLGLSDQLVLSRESEITEPYFEEKLRELMRRA